jgi:RHS repeat-associated protein
VTYGYDDNGQLVRRSEGGEDTTYRYDGVGALRGATLPGGATVEYELDGLGRRIARRRDGQVVDRWVYGAGTGPIAELDQDGSVRTRFVYGTRSHVPDYMERGGKRYRLLTDDLGSVRKVVDAASGVVEQEIDYDPYGGVLRDTNPGFQPFGFAGGLYDRDTGLVHFDAREYDPETGRWTTRDPIGFEAGATNLYGYVAGDPVNSIDPAGLDGEGISNAIAGWGDEYTFGATDFIRDKLGINNVDKCSAAYKGGQIGGMLTPSPGKLITAAKNGRRAATGGRGAKGDPHPDPSPTAPFGKPGPDYEWRGPKDKGSWYNPKTGEYWRPDPHHGPPHGPHWDYRDPDGNEWRVYPDGRVEPK